MAHTRQRKLRYKGKFYNYPAIPLVSNKHGSLKRNKRKVKRR